MCLCGVVLGGLGVTLSFGGWVWWLGMCVGLVCGFVLVGSGDVIVGLFVFYWGCWGFGFRFLGVWVLVFVFAFVSWVCFYLSGLDWECVLLFSVCFFFILVGLYVFCVFGLILVVFCYQEAMWVFICGVCGVSDSFLGYAYRGLGVVWVCLYLCCFALGAGYRGVLGGCWGFWRDWFGVVCLGFWGFGVCGFVEGCLGVVFCVVLGLGCMCAACGCCVCLELVVCVVMCVVLLCVWSLGMGCGFFMVCFVGRFVRGFVIGSGLGVVLGWGMFLCCCFYVVVLVCLEGVVVYACLGFRVYVFGLFILFAITLKLCCFLFGCLAFLFRLFGAGCFGVVTFS